MTQPNDSAYYTARAAKERECAKSAASPAVAAIHLQMATSYDQLARRVAADEIVSA